MAGISIIHAFSCSSQDMTPEQAVAAALQKSQELVRLQCNLPTHHLVRQPSTVELSYAHPQGKTNIEIDCSQPAGPYVRQLKRAMLGLKSI